MRVVWSADDDGVNVLAFHQLAIVLRRHDVGGGPAGIAIELLREDLAVFSTLHVHIAHCDIVHTTGLECPRHVMAARNAATADLANAYAIARRIGTEHAGRDDQGHRERCRRGSKTLAEVTAREGKRLG